MIKDKFPLHKNKICPSKMCWQPIPWPQLVFSLLWTSTLKGSVASEISLGKIKWAWLSQWQSLPPISTKKLARNVIECVCLGNHFNSLPFFCFSFCLKVRQSLKSLSDRVWTFSDRIWNPNNWAVKMCVSQTAPTWISSSSQHEFELFWHLVSIWNSNETF